MPTRPVIPYATCFQPAPSSATCWTKFGQVDDSSGTVVCAEVANGKHAMMVACHGCKTIFCYKASNGTSSLVNHTCKLSVAAAAGQPCIDLLLKPKVLPSQPQIRHCTRLTAKVCAEDFRPFHIVACGGFRKMLQFVLDVGVQSKGRMDINDLLTDERTVKRAADSRKTETEKLLVRFVCKHIEDKLGAGSTTDLYKSKDTGVYYMTVSLTLIDPYWIMSARTLGCIEFPRNMAHTGVNILAMFNQMLQKYCADAKGQVMTTTDGASNNNALGDEHPHITCQCHIISTCIQYVLDKRTRIVAGQCSAPFYEFYGDAPLHFDMIDAAKDLVRWVKQADCNTEPKLKKGCPTRWDGLLLTLDSIWVDYQNKVEQLSARRPSAKHCIEAVNFTILVEMVRFLTPFKIGSKTLKATNKPTIHLSCYTSQKLLLHCVAVDDDREVPTIVGGVDHDNNPSRQ
ncbi:Hermes transposase DNA-binding domain [Fragilaria crotonensis]|nr:Hermes transposase DNA-binding domain [Fragilaria crotonensis]